MTVNQPHPNAPDTPGPGQMIRAGLGLLGLILVWIVAVIPCALWLGFNLIFSRSAPDPYAGRTDPPEA